MAQNSYEPETGGPGQQHKLDPVPKKSKVLWYLLGAAIIAVGAVLFWPQ